jgi:lipopolysaccharide transport system ATP-binding protein
MSNTVIKVENISKQYRLGHVGTGTLSHDLNRWWHKVRGKEDPYLRVGEQNNRSIKGCSDYVWALKDINFEVKHGEVLGIIGKNGAGKSTLLKILSRVTTPTTGTLKMKGRVASLLEVGTGFHPELSGRENIYLNGAILGMTKQEVNDKFDEIVDFSGVERYVDTPVKRYSSGMHVRLAFAVAAHLEPEILIIDEVLAVGDAEFQKKCLGKMKEVSGQGRTVLFVSHNMTAVKSLCTKIVFLENGTVKEVGETHALINSYLSQNTYNKLCKSYESEQLAPGNDKVKMKRMEVIPLLNNNENLITVDTELDILFEFWNNVTDIEINLSLHLYTLAEECVFNVGTQSKILSKGLHKGVCRIPANLLNDGMYLISIMVVGDKSFAIYNFEKTVAFEVNENRETSGWHGKWIGFVRPKLVYTLE